ncbi:unnamed protein product [Rhizophagus irregularis]|nr:unnamed protein product [Rhizophagus irregularis]
METILEQSSTNNHDLRLGTLMNPDDIIDELQGKEDSFCTTEKNGMMLTSCRKKETQDFIIDVAIIIIYVTESASEHFNLKIGCWFS